MAKHYLKSRKTEIAIGFVALVIGSVLLWDAFDNRGKPLPWPLSAFMPW